MGSAVAGQTITHVDLGTDIPIAFARAPTTTATGARDLNVISGGH